MVKIGKTTPMSHRHWLTKYQIKGPHNQAFQDSSCVFEVLNSDREEAVGLYSCQVCNLKSSAVCNSYVICKTPKNSIISSHLTQDTNNKHNVTVNAKNADIAFYSKTSSAVADDVE